jgi:hypothetical protein
MHSAGGCQCIVLEATTTTAASVLHPTPPAVVGYDDMIDV